MIIIIADERDVWPRLLINLISHGEYFCIGKIYFVRSLSIAFVSLVCNPLAIAVHFWYLMNFLHFSLSLLIEWQKLTQKEFKSLSSFSMGRRGCCNKRLLSSITCPLLIEALSYKLRFYSGLCFSKCHNFFSKKNNSP